MTAAAEGLMAGRRRPLRLGHALVTLHDVAILTWRVAPERLRALLPAGLEPFVDGEKALVSAVLFRNRALRPARLGVPRLRCAQLNVRSYLRDPETGAAGSIWFHDIVVSSRALAWLSRAIFRVPCRSLPLRLATDAATGAWHYAASDGSVTVRARLAEQSPALEPPLLDLLTNPHTAYVRDPRGAGVRRWSIWHPPQSLSALDVEHAELAPLAPLGLAARRPDVALHVAAVPYEVYFPARIVDVVRGRRWPACDESARE